MRFSIKDTKVVIGSKLDKSVALLSSLLIYASSEENLYFLMAFSLERQALVGVGIVTYNKVTYN